MSAVQTDVVADNAAPDTTEYRKIIQHLAAEKINRRIPNGKPAHAAILLEAMFTKADRDMRIFSRSLDESTYDNADLIDAAQRFLSRPATRLRILLQNRIDVSALKSHPLIKALSEMTAALTTAHEQKLQIRFAEGAYSKDSAKHLAVMDDLGFRFEVDHDKTQAIANFNEPRVASELATAFDRAFMMAKPAI